MKSYITDVTAEFVAGNGIKKDVSGWQNVTIQIVAPGGTINIQGSNDANAITGVSDGTSYSAINFSTIQATNLADGSATTSISAAGLYSIKVLAKYLQIGGAGATASKVILFYNKPY